jgi:hypothetical protein
VDHPLIVSSDKLSLVTLENALLYQLTFASLLALVVFFAAQSLTLDVVNISAWF